MKQISQPFAKHHRPLARAALPLAAMAFAGCASVPDVTVSYRPVTWQVAAAVVHTITCTRDGSRAIIARDGSFTPVYRADTKESPLTVRLKDLDRFFADSDFSASFTDDGRLKSVNQSTNGQGETIAKSLVSTVVTLGAAGVMGVAAAAPEGAAQPNKTYLLSDGRLIELRGKPSSPICKIVMDWSAALAPESLPQIVIVQAKLITEAIAQPVPVVAASEQASVLLEELKAHLDLRATVTAKFDDDNQAGLQPVKLPAALADDAVGLPLQQTRSFSLKAVPVALLKPDDVIKKSTVTVPRPVSDGLLKVPIPKPALFGKQTFQLALAESGRITSIGYGRTAGAAGALNAVGALAGEQTAADTAEAAALKAAADLIAQQARLSNCVLKPTECK